MANQGPIRAGLAYVELILKNKLDRGLAAAAAQLKAFGAAVARIGASMAKLGLGILAPLGLAAKLFADVGSKLLDLSQRTGISVETLSALGYAAEQSGASMEDLAKALTATNKRLVEAVVDGGAAADTFTALGLSIQDLQGLNPDARFLRIAEALARVEDPAQRAALAMQMWGESGTRLLPMLAGGAAGLQDLLTRAQRIGVVMSTADAQAAEEFGDAISDLWMTIKMVAVQIGSALAPALKLLADWLSGAASVVRDFLRENQGLIMALAMAGAGLVGLGAAVATLGGLFYGLGATVGALAGAFGTLTAAVGAVLSPAGLVVVAVAAIAYAIANMTTDGIEALDWLKNAFGGLLDFIGEVWGGIQDAISAGDLALAFQVAWAGAKVIWSEAVLFLLGVWTNFLEKFQTGWARITRWFEDAWHGVTGALGQGLMKLGELFSWIWKKITRQTDEGWSEMLQRVRRASQEMANVDNQLQVQRQRDRQGEDQSRRARLEETTGLAGAHQQAVAAREEFRQVREQAAYQRWLADFTREMESWGRDGPGGRAEIGQAKGALTAGTFSSAALSGLGAGRTQDRIASATEETADNTRRLLEEVGLSFE